MSQPKKPVPEPGLHELLNDEIGRLVMRADGVARHDVEALVTRVKPARAERTSQPRKTEKVS
jgi:hypothetical protein